MTHYDHLEFEKMLEDVKLRNKIQEGSVATATKHDDFYEGAHASEELVKELLEEELEPNADLKKAAYRANNQDKKQTLGKPRGARYCFIGDICLAMNAIDLQSIANKFRDLVSLIDDGEYRYSSHLVSEMLQEMVRLDDKFLEHLIAARVDGLKKYTVDNYRDEINIDDLLDAFARHMLKVVKGQDIDDQSGVHHFGHMSANLIIIETQLRLYHG